MKFDSPFRHQRPASVAEAKVIQTELCRHVVRRDDFGTVKRVAGVDIGIDRASGSGRAAAAVLDFPGCDILEEATVSCALDFPYVPGYLSFREVPPALAALERLEQRPDLIICDGQGIAHPRRFGLACHLSLVTGIPAIGAAKSRLIGTYDEPGPDKGDWSRLQDGDETIGAVVRTRSRVQPVFVSVGHRVALATAVDLVLTCCKRYRLPETTRAAHRLASGPRRR